MSKREHLIKEIKPGSIAEEMELEPGDKLLAINDHEIEDVFDYYYFTNDDYVVLLVEKTDGDQWELEIEKDPEEDLGIVFEQGLMDDYKSCSNNCIFCFIDQNPPGMRETIYFKDDDSRLSFLQGNYVTLTNTKQKDLDRIVQYHLSPINVSVHTTNPELRCRMLHNRFAGQALDKMRFLYEHDVEMNGQIVLCKGINDGGELERTIEDLTEYIPTFRSLSVVPVGLTRFREGLYPLEPFEREDARQVLAIIEKWQQYCRERFGMSFVQASDEWYITAGLPFPEAERYDGFNQLENGVGVMRLQHDEFLTALSNGLKAPEGAARHVTFVCGRLGERHNREMMDRFMEAYPDFTVDTAAIRNDFFGERITVTGLITGGDLIRQLKERGYGDRILIPHTMLRVGEEIFLDDVTLDEVRNALQVPVTIVKSSGQDLLNALLGLE